jgi:hypothetical protein
MSFVLKLAVVSIMLVSSASAQVAVWTQHNDNNRSGANSQETSLTPSTVKAGFGKLFSYQLDDQTYSQPLYIPNLTMSVDGQRHNVVFITTVNNSVYAWDADSQTANGGQPLWHKNLTPPGARAPNVQTDVRGACGGNYHDFAANFGTVGTPVIDVANSALYVVARTVEQSGKVNVQRLHALDIRNGTEIMGGPVIIGGAYKGVQFDPELQNQRSALALVKGVVYIAWSSHCDYGEYHGWVMGYRASNLAQVTAWNDSPLPGSMAGIWQGGQGATADEAGNLYFLTGNGTSDGINNFGESAIQLVPNPTGILNVGQFFTPSNWASLNNGDTDLGSAGVVLIPGTSLVAGGGKQGMIYVMNSRAMGGFTTGTQDKVVQEFQATFIQNGGPSAHIHGGPVFFNGGTGAQYLYVWGENDYLRAYQYSNPHNNFSGNGAQPASELLFNATAVAHSSMFAPQVESGMPGGFLSTSSNGTNNGIVWALTPHACDANHNVEPGALFAFDATNFSGSGTQKTLVELWDSTQNLARDDVGYFAKYTYPTVAAGKVYVGSWGAVPPDIEGKCSESSQPSAPLNQGELVVYGLNPPLLQVSGKITFLRANDVGTGFGPPADYLDTEIEVQLDSQPGKSFGFQLRADDEEYARHGMLGVLRSAFRSNSTVVIDYYRTGTNNGRMIRVAKEK